MTLSAGDYTLTIDGNGDATGSYTFRLLDLASATPIAFGSPVSGALNPAPETDLYRFDIAGGEQLFFNITARTNDGSSRWRLLDPFLNTVFETSFTINSDVGPLTLTRPGTYTLLLEGRHFDTVVGSYTVVVVPVSDELNPQPLSLNTTLTEAIDEAGEVDRYTFTLGGSTRIYFDSLTNNSAMLWNLAGPSGALVTSRSFNSSDAIDGFSTMTLMAGDYTLTIDGNGDATGSYSFRLLDLASATPIALGAPVSGALNPAPETDLYRFDIVGGERLYFDITARSNDGSSRWRLLDPFLNTVFETSFTINSDVGPLTLTRPGTYTLLLEGRHFDTIAGNYTVVVVSVSDELNPVPLSLNTTLTEAIDEAGEVDRYTFTLGGTTRIYFDSLTNNSSMLWSLAGPSGALVTSRSFNSSDAIDGFSTMTLMAGDYTLTIDGNGDAIGTYSFRLLDLTSATPIAFGAPVSGALNPAPETDLYRFDIVGGERLYFDITARTNDGSSRWRLLDPFLNTVFETSFTINSDVGPLTLTRPGTYTLLLEGRHFDTIAGNYTVVIVPVSDELNPVALSLNTALTEAIDEAGSRSVYVHARCFDANLFR
jgi:hypothetical protein